MAANNKMRTKPMICLIWVMTWPVLVGCAEVSRVVGSTWHDKCGWKAEDYFDDRQVIALCHAIEANDIEEIDRLVARGADVNAKGKGNMTPLLWAFPDNKLERFKRLLELGADPNVIIDSDFNTRGGMSPGDSVTHLACQTAFPGYFEAVFAHGADPNLQRTSVIGLKDTPLFTVITSGGANKKQKIQLLIDLGADINYINAAWQTPVMQATSWGGQYDIALMLLNAGADHRVYVPKSNTRLCISCLPTNVTAPHGLRNKSPIMRSCYSGSWTMESRSKRQRPTESAGNPGRIRMENTAARWMLRLPRARRVKSKRQKSHFQLRSDFSGTWLEDRIKTIRRVH